MNLTKTFNQKRPFRALGAAAALALSFGFAGSAHALATFSATSELTFTVQSVQDAAGNNVALDPTNPFGAQIDFFLDPAIITETILPDPTGGTLTSSATLLRNGLDVTADGGAFGLLTNESITLTSTAAGTANGGGFVSSLVDALGSLVLIGDLLQDLNITIAYTWNGLAEATADNIVAGDRAFADASFQAIGSTTGNPLILIDNQLQALANGVAVDTDTNGSPASLPGTQSGTLTFNLLAGLDIATQIGNTISTGFAEAVNVVPVPATLALMGVGLLGLGAAKRRQGQQLAA